jgi:hypothetical protein
MRRKKALWGGRAVSILIAGFVGYLFGGWNPSASHNAELSAAQMVALRFPQDLANSSVASPAAPAVVASATTTADTQSALLNPEPMVPQVSAAQPSITQVSFPQTTAADISVPQAPMQTAAVAPAAPSPAVAAKRPQPVSTAAQISEAKQMAAAIHRHTSERPGFVLNDAQIASIKERLNLTPDQEEMWPAVEAALRNLAYTRAREARRSGEPANAQLASADPDSIEVQGLKSAAIPLLMSFNSEQKDEVRNLAHVMGLDQLATQF